MNDTPKPAPVQRTSTGLRDALFDAIDALRRGEIDHKQASAFCNLSSAICKTVQLELEVERQDERLRPAARAATLSLGTVNK